MDKWIQQSNLKKGALSHQLGISEESNITMGLLQDIKKAKVGTTIKNNYELGHDEIKVTDKLKRRVNLAINLKRIQ